MRPPCKMDIQLLESRDAKNECNAIRRCGGHVYQFTRLDDAKWIATHRFNGGPVEAKKGVMELVAAQANRKLPAAATDPKFAKSVWAKTTTIAEKYNEPGRFTAFIGYEWTSNAGGGDNLHRNIIYRDNKDKADQVLPYTTFQSENPEDLWKWMTEWEKTTGGKILAIPHNGNLSNGRMFALTTFSGDPLTKAWADARQRWEPLFEAIQMKGQSESHPSLSPTDDFAAYELWDRGNLTQTPKKPGMIAGEYAREALKNGLKVEQDLGTNPFKFGMAGGTDTHNGLVAVEEDNFFGKFPSAEPRAAITRRTLTTSYNAKSPNIRQMRRATAA